MDCLWKAMEEKLDRKETKRNQGNDNQRTWTGNWENSQEQQGKGPKAPRINKRYDLKENSWNWKEIREITSERKREIYKYIWEDYYKGTRVF